MYWGLVRPPALYRAWFKNHLWRVPNDCIYLTFDDGPDPEATPFVLKTLRDLDIKATFFCLGKNVEANPELFRAILSDGHTVGNHSYSHPDGWFSDNKKYLDDVLLASQFIHSDLFRPPYGRITKSLSGALEKKFKIVMWDLMSFDFDHSISPELCFKKIIRNVRPGSVIVFHDSTKAFKNLSRVLPQTITYLKDNGFRFDALPTGKL